MINLKFIGNALKRYDFSFFFISLMIFAVGILNLYSATNGSVINPHAGVYKSQIIYFCFSLVVGLIISFIDIKTIYRYSYFFYFFNIFLLILVFILGDVGMGARRWIVFWLPVRLQPSELMKVTVVLALARWFTRNNPDRDMGFREVLFPFLIALGLPYLLS